MCSLAFLLFIWFAHLLEYFWEYREDFWENNLTIVGWFLLLFFGLYERLCFMNLINNHLFVHFAVRCLCLVWSHNKKILPCKAFVHTQSTLWFYLNKLCVLICLMWATYPSGWSCPLDEDDCRCRPLVVWGLFITRGTLLSPLRSRRKKKVDCQTVVGVVFVRRKSTTADTM